MSHSALKRHTNKTFIGGQVLSTASTPPNSSLFFPPPSEMLMNSTGVDCTKYLLHGPGANKLIKLNGVNYY